MREMNQMHDVTALKKVLEKETGRSVRCELDDERGLMMIRVSAVSDCDFRESARKISDFEFDHFEDYGYPFLVLPEMTHEVADVCCQEVLADENAFLELACTQESYSDWCSDISHFSDISLEQAEEFALAA